ncbi:helix-turn-helix domain-containing protein [Sediminibacterium sp.]|uniref:helix-turn-helix domain-containing protein n=1 Tax=Sediminibacterium sp. TaxID=1917865 RepID=UPI0027300F55|nr:helix-turn-helix transcriptional regulator [Sediminibacterium sp.]MDP2420097.1 helix-turn-helix transcriptional regulator [Sediminibacterium sp.]
MGQNSHIHLYKSIGKVIGSYLKEVKGISQKDFADSINMNRATLSNIIAGRQQISIHLLYKIANELKVQPVDLLPPMDLFQKSEEELKVNFNNLLKEKGISKESQETILNIIKQPHK